MAKKPDVPTWVTVLNAAEAWGIPPWEVEEGSYLWLARWVVMKSEMHRGNKANKKLKSKAR